MARRRRRPNSDNSFFDSGPTFVSGTELQFVSSPPATIPTKTGTFSVPVYVQTLASPNSGNISATTPTPSNGVSLAFAPTPAVTSVSTGRAPAAGPATGGTKLTIKGAGFTAASVVTFTDEFSPFGVPFSGATSLNFTVVSASEITLRTPESNAGIDDVQVCTTTGCSTAVPKRDTFIFFPPGSPQVSSSSPGSGKAKGGTNVTIHGTNLGFVVGVKFGKVSAKKFANVQALLDSGSTRARDGGGAGRQGRNHRLDHAGDTRERQDGQRLHEGREEGDVPVHLLGALRRRGQGDASAPWPLGPRVVDDRGDLEEIDGWSDAVETRDALP